MDTTQRAKTRIRDYIQANPVGVISSINPDGTPHGASVYVCTASHDILFFVTKSDTQKFKNCIERPQVSLTIHNEKQSSTLQLSGLAKVSHDPVLIEQVMSKLARVHAAQAEWLPPLAKLRAGAYQIVSIQPKKARLAEFRGLDIGSADIFSEVHF